MRNRHKYAPYLKSGIKKRWGISLFDSFPITLCDSRGFRGVRIFPLHLFFRLTTPSFVGSCPSGSFSCRFLRCSGAFAPLLCLPSTFHSLRFVRFPVTFQDLAHLKTNPWILSSFATVCRIAAAFCSTAAGSVPVGFLLPFTQLPCGFHVNS